MLSFALAALLVPALPATLDDTALVTRFQGTVESEQEVADTPVDSKAHGHVRVVIDDAADTIQVHVVVANLSGPAIGAHLHLAAAGTNGPIVVDLSRAITQQNPHVVKIHATVPASIIAGPLESATDRLGALTRALDAGLVYFNVHTEDFPSGEARGQL